MLRPVWTEMYRDNEILWNPSHKNHFNSILKNDAWVSIADQLSTGLSKKVSPDECRKKMITLLSAYRREKSKMKKSMSTGSGADEIYKSVWFAFDSLNFLANKDTPRKRRSTIPDEEHIEDDDNTSPNTTSEANQSQREKMCPPSTIPTSRKKEKKDSNDERLDKAFQLLTKAADESENDECKSYGFFVANKIKNYSSKTRNSVQHAISNILFNADNGFYDQNVMFPNHNIQFGPHSGAQHFPVFPTSTPMYWNQHNPVSPLDSNTQYSPTNISTHTQSSYSSQNVNSSVPIHSPYTHISNDQSPSPNPSISSNLTAEDLSLSDFI